MSQENTMVIRQIDVNKAFVLEVFSVSYNAIEALAALVIGIITYSISLESFGLDSIIEIGSASILLWRLSAERHGAEPERAEFVERRASRLVGISLFVLAAFIIFESLYTLITRKQAEPTLWGIVLAVLSLIIMPILAKLKLNVAKRIESHALRADAFETIVCAYLSFTLLIGLGANYLWGWWWADPLAALVMVYFIVREAREAFSGEHEEEHEL